MKFKTLLNLSIRIIRFFTNGRGIFCPKADSARAGAGKNHSHDCPENDKAGNRGQADGKLPSGDIGNQHPPKGPLRKKQEIIQ